MRIAIFHSSYRSGDVSGENTVVADERRLLSEAGHEVVGWTPSPMPGGIGKVSAAVDTVWSRKARSELRDLIDRRRPDVVHLHNLFPMLSPGVIRSARAAGIPVVLTLHNYRLMCLSGNLYRSGKTCDVCVGHVPWRGVAHACYNGSRMAGLPMAVSLAGHGAIRSFEGVSLYLAVSDHVKRFHQRAGFPVDRISVKRNFSWPGIVREGPGDYFLYVGRLAPEKGVSYLARMWSERDVELRIVGSGAEAGQLRSAGPSVRLFDPVPHEQVSDLISRARAVVVPSLWDETAGKVVVEAAACGVPAIVSRVGGLPEIVEDGGSGLIAEPADDRTWKAAVDRLLDDAESERMGREALARWTTEFDPTAGLRQLEDAYAKVSAPSR